MMNQGFKIGEGQSIVGLGKCHNHLVLRFPCATILELVLQRKEQGWASSGVFQFAQHFRPRATLWGVRMGQQCEGGGIARYSSRHQRLRVTTYLEQTYVNGAPNGLGISGGALLDRNGGRAHTSAQKSDDLAGATRRP